LLALVGDEGGDRIGSPEDFAGWVVGQPSEELVEPFTFVVPVDGVLRLAPRRSEHVACATGASVLAAGEITVRLVGDLGDRAWTVAEVTNQSTGYCPDPACWPAVAAALGLAGLSHPGGFTVEVVFRRCVTCRELNIVREDHFVCVFCDGDLPTAWNIDLPH
jgi:hypothetical protein